MLHITGAILTTVIVSKDFDLSVAYLFAVDQYRDSHEVILARGHSVVYNVFHDL